MVSRSRFGCSGKSRVPAPYPALSIFIAGNAPNSTRKRFHNGRAGRRHQFNAAVPMNIQACLAAASRLPEPEQVKCRARISPCLLPHSAASIPIRPRPAPRLPRRRKRYPPWRRPRRLRESALARLKCCESPLRPRPEPQRCGWRSLSRAADRRFPDNFPDLDQSAASDMFILCEHCDANAHARWQENVKSNPALPCTPKTRAADPSRRRHEHPLWSLRFLPAPRARSRDLRPARARRPSRQATRPDTPASTSAPRNMSPLMPEKQSR